MSKMKIDRINYSTEYHVSTDLRLIIFHNTGHAYIDTNSPCEITMTDGEILVGHVYYPGIGITRKYAAEKLKEWKNENK